MDREEKLQGEERELAQPEHPEHRGGREPGEYLDGNEPPRERREATKEYHAAFEMALRGNARELRAMQVDSDVDGGFLVASEQFVMEVIADLDDAVPFRGMARTFKVAKAVSLGAPKRTAKMSTFAWGSEVGAPTADTALKFGKRKLFPHPAVGEILVSRDLMRQGVMSPSEIVRSEMARDAGELQENAFMTGSGAEQPLGIFTASADGISTGRDVSTGNTTTAPTFDGLKQAKGTLKQAYRPKAKWLAHRDFETVISKIKDGDGRYIWAESVRAGEPDRLLGIPLILSEFAPNTFTTGLYVAILGEFFKGYWIADAMDLDIQVLQELNARTNQIGFLGRFKMDGAPVLEEAFVRVTLT